MDDFSVFQKNRGILSLVLLSALVKRCFASRMRDFFVRGGYIQKKNMENKNRALAATDTIVLYQWRGLRQCPKLPEFSAIPDRLPLENRERGRTEY